MRSIAFCAQLSSVMSASRAFAIQDSAGERESRTHLLESQLGRLGDARRVLGRDVADVGLGDVMHHRQEDALADVERLRLGEGEAHEGHPAGVEERGQLEGAWEKLRGKGSSAPAHVVHDALRLVDALVHPARALVGLRRAG